MAGGDFINYTEALLAIETGLIDLDGSTIVATLHSASYTPNNDTDATWADVSASELATAGGYTQGGQALSSITVARSGAAVIFDAANVVWNPATLTAKYVVLTKRAGGSLVSGDLLIGYAELEVGGTVSPSGAALTVAWNAGGIFTAGRA